MEFVEINLEENEEALEFIKEHGFKRLLVVIGRKSGFAQAFVFSGFQIDWLEVFVEK